MKSNRQPNTTMPAKPCPEKVQQGSSGSQASLAHPTALDVGKLHLVTEGVQEQSKGNVCDGRRANR